MKILFEHRGEVSYTRPDPVAEIKSISGDKVTAIFRAGDIEQTIDLTEQKAALISSDNWGLVMINRWTVGEVPEVCGLTVAAWISYSTEIKYYLGFGGSPFWPRQWFLRLIKLGEAEKYAAIKLLNTKKFRSEFRQSLRTQLEAWLNAETLEHKSPFSFKQWNAILDQYTRLDAKRTATSLYYNR